MDQTTSLEITADTEDHGKPWKIIQSIWLKRFGNNSIRKGLRCGQIRDLISFVFTISSYIQFMSETLVGTAVGASVVGAAVGPCVVGACSSNEVLCFFNGPR